jgi:hypothetical protein
LGVKLGLPRNPIRWVAVICVAITSAYIMWMGYRLNETLSGPNWCARALGAEKASPGQTIKGLDACISLLTIQLKAIATNSHILFGVVALCLLILIVIVVAGGKLDLELPDKLGGGGAHMGPSSEPIPVKVEQPPGSPVPVAPTAAPPQPEHTGPAMPEPK